MKKYDSEWLEQNYRRIKTVVNTVDWSKKDAELLPLVKEVIAKMKEGKPERITWTTIGNKLGISGWLSKRKEKLPLTKAYIDLEVESLEEYHIRKIKWPIEELERQGKEITLWNLIETAGVKPKYMKYIQIPNCLDNSQRIQSIKFKQVFKKNVNGFNELEYILFFIEVEEDLSELPKEIKVLPLIIKPDDEIYSFDFKFDKIFIKKKGEDESSIIGCAILKNGLETNEFYRVFEVKPCGMKDYFEYIATFKNKYSKITMNIYAMEGNVIFIS